MKINCKFFFVTFFCILLNQVYLQNYQTKFDNYCQTNKALSTNWPSLQNNSQNIAGFAFQIKSLTSIINNGNAGSLISDVGAFIILMAILTVLVIITFFVFLGFCCCCERYESAAYFKSKILNLIGFIFLIGFTGLFIAMIVFIGLLNTNLSTTSCSIGRLGNDAINGVSFPPYNFIGLNNVSFVVGNLSQQIPQISKNKQDFALINAKNLKNFTTPAINSLGLFYKNYSNATTSDGNGGFSQPFTIKNLTPNINALIQKEFSFFDQTAQEMNAISFIGILLASLPFYNSSQSSLNSANNQITDIKNIITNNVEPITNGFSYAITLSPIGYWIGFGLGILIIIFSFLMFVFVCYMNKNKNDKCRFCTKFFLSLNGFFIIILGLLAIGLLIASTAVTSLCQTIPQILPLNKVDLNKLFVSWGVSLNSNTINVINGCLATDSTGNLLDVLNTSDQQLISLVFLMEGLASFNAAKYNISINQLFSPAINTTVNSWTLAQNSLVPDQPQAISNLNLLNSYVNCGGISYQFNSQNCSSPNCYGILQQLVPNIPACSNINSAAIYNNLKLFTTSEFNLLTNMISNLNSVSFLTPNKYQTDYRSAYLSLFPNFNNIVANIGGFLNSVPPTNGGLNYNTNCTFLRNEVFNIQNSLCFNFNNSLYYFTALFVFFVLFFFFFSCCICCALKCVPKQILENELKTNETEINYPNLKDPDQIYERNNNIIE